MSDLEPPRPDVQAEEYVLSGITGEYALEVIPEVRQLGLDSTYLTGLPHVKIWDAVQAIYDRGEPIRPDVIVKELGVDGARLRVGDVLMKLSGIRTLPGEIPYYAAILLKTAPRQEGWLEAGRIAQELERGARDPQEILADGIARLEAVYQRAAGQSPRRRGVVAVSAASMTMKAAVWLAERRIPVGGITLLGGREGIGKSTIAYDYAARITRGRVPGHYQGTPRSVGVVATEDDWESVILPRLVAARADLARIFRIEARTEQDQYETISVPAHLDELAEVCAEQGIVLVIIDPIMSVINGSLDTHKDREVRQALDPLNRFSSESGVAVLALIHVNKSSGTDPLNSIMASKAFTAVARSVLYCILDPEAENEDRYLFGHPKSNLGPKQPTLAYRIIECKVEQDVPDGPGAIGTSRVVWDGQDDRSIRDAMEPQRTPRAAGELAERVLEWLADQRRAVSAAELAEEFSDVKRNTLDQNLRRMVKRGTITRPFHGHYSMPVARSDTRRSDSPLETSEASEVSDLSEGLTDLTDVTTPETSEPVSGNCVICKWPLDSHAHETQCGGTP